MVGGSKDGEVEIVKSKQGKNCENVKKRYRRGSMDFAT